MRLSRFCGSLSQGLFGWLAHNARVVCFVAVSPWAVRARYVNGITSQKHTLDLALRDPLAGAPSDLAAGETTAPKSPVSTLNPTPGKPAAEAASSVAKQAVAEPYDFKGIKLGISIDQFRHTPFPDTLPDTDPLSQLDALKNLPQDLLKRGPVPVVCTGDSNSKDILENPIHLFLTGDDEAAGVTRCGFYQKYLGSQFPLALSMGGGDYASVGYFSFIRDPVTAY
jgi:hypothetical protein